MDLKLPDADTFVKQQVPRQAFDHHPVPGLKRLVRLKRSTMLPGLLCGWVARDPMIHRANRH